MTSLNEYWKHWEHKKYWMSSDDVPEGVWKAYEIAPENEIVAPNWEPYIRKAFREMGARGIGLMHCLCALRLWTQEGQRCETLCTVHGNSVRRNGVGRI